MLASQNKIDGDLFFSFLLLFSSPASREKYKNIYSKMWML